MVSVRGDSDATPARRSSRASAGPPGRQPEGERPLAEGVGMGSCVVERGVAAPCEVLKHGVSFLCRGAGRGEVYTVS